MMPAQAMESVAAASPPLLSANRKPEAQASLVRPSVQLANVGKVHGGVELLRGVDCDVAPGELVCVIGPPGSGTSMLLAMVAGLEDASSGRILCHGRPVRRTGSDRALLGQNPGLLPWLDARRNVEFALRQSPLAAFERAAIARRCLDQVSMHRLASTLADELAEGDQHRVALALALAHDPAVLLFDEPFAGLDAHDRASLHHELEALWIATRKTVVFATHDAEEAVMLADRIVVLTRAPGRVLVEIDVDLPRPRRADDASLRAAVCDLGRCLARR